MESQPTISIVIPAYNAASFLKETIQSVLLQTFDGWELIIVNDGSTDNTTEIAETSCSEDRRIRLINKKNGGVSSSRNLGAQSSRGELIAFLDADDKWLPRKLKEHIDFMNFNPQVGVSFARVELLNFYGKSIKNKTGNQLTQFKPENFLYTNPTVTTSNVVVRRNLFNELGGFNEKINYCEDMEFLFRCLCCSNFKIEGIDQVLVQYRIHNTGLSSALYKMEEGWKTMMEKVRCLRPVLVEQHYTAAYASQLQYLAEQALKQKVSSEVGIRFISQAFQTDWKFLIKQPRAIRTAFLLYTKHHLSSFARVY